MTLLKQPATTNISLLSVAALGVVFGDIGTSPLYTFKTVLLLAGHHPNPETIIGSVSLIMWTLILIGSIKYISLALKIDNDGEGGILALMSLLGLKNKPRAMIIAIGLLGAALIYGDGAITPAISVLSALEGLEIISPELGHYVLPLAVIVLILLFAIQSQGTALIGRAFGPVMVLWFITIGALGLWGIIKHPYILVALNPLYGLKFLFASGIKGFFILGGVFLCVTGAEALYADLGHFGARAIRRAWYCLVFPALIINYMGQAALVLNGVPTKDNMFYMLCPKFLMLPMVILATLATIIASQSIITGAFSMTRQAIQLGWLPRLRVTQTSSRGYGQIYVRIANLLLMIATVGLTISFQKSDNLAAAYGIAVSATMFLTSILLFIALREVWHWNIFKAGAVAGFFMVIDATFFSSNITKFTSGGYIPIAFAFLIYGIMYIWHKGMQSIPLQLKDKDVPVATFLKEIRAENVQRVAKTAIFLTSREVGIPPIMLWHVKKNHVLQSQVIILKVKTLSVPWCKEKDRLKVVEMTPGIWRAVAYYGFMEQPNIPKALKNMPALGYDIALDGATYYLGYERIFPRSNIRLIQKYFVYIFAFLHRNALPVSDYLRLPPKSVLEIGRHVDL
jgi:KUP system potassium uptake protein